MSMKVKQTSWNALVKFCKFYSISLPFVMLGSVGVGFAYKMDIDTAVLIGSMWPIVIPMVCVNRARNEIIQYEWNKIRKHD